MKILIEEMQRKARESNDYAKDEALRSIDAGETEDAEKYAVNARKYMAIAKTWECAVELVVSARYRIETIKAKKEG